MDGLSFGEQVKIVLKRRGMTIKELAEQLEEATGRKTSRQNLTQKLGRDNFQEQDMRQIAAVLGCSFSLSILGDDAPISYEAGRVPALRRSGDTQARQTDEEISQTEEPPVQAEAVGVQAEEKRLPDPVEESEPYGTDPSGHAPEHGTDPSGHAPEHGTDPSGHAPEQELTIGEIYELHSELEKLEKDMKALDKAGSLEELEKKRQQVRARGVFLKKTFLNGLTKRRKKSEEEKESFEPVITYEDDLDEDLEKGELNPKTGHEYYSNSVRMHPTLIGYVQVYDRMDHSWTDMTEWAFLAYQERKQALLGDDYEPPIYLD